MLDTVLFYFLSCCLPKRLICVELYWPFLISEFQLTNREYKETEERKGRWRMCSLGHQGLVTSLHEMMVLLGNLLYYICFLVTALFQLVFMNLLYYLRTSLILFMESHESYFECSTY